MRRALPGGLRFRLGAWVALVVLASSALTFGIVYSGTGSELRHQIDRDIAGEQSELAQAAVGGAAQSGRGAGAARAVGSGESERAPGAAAAGSAKRAAAVTGAREVSLRVARYIRAQPFKASSTLLFAIVPGARTASNRPELFAPERADNGETPAKQAQENRLAARLLTAKDGYSTLPLPDVGDLRLLERTYTLPSGRRVTIAAGEPLAEVSHAQGSVARAFLLAFAFALVGALVAAYLVGTRVSRPLRRMAAVAARVDAGDLHPRIHDLSGEASELRVLADAFNHMLDRLTDAFAGQRAFVADASHELRTPLTVIRGQVEVLAAQSSPSEQDVRRVESLVLAEVARITRLVEDLLLLAKAEQTEFLRVREIDLQDYVALLWEGITVLAPRRFELLPVPAGVLRADPDQLAQALRNLIANAIDHTREGDGLVRLSIRELSAGRIELAVEDNGPGIAPEQRERVFDRFHRTDSARDRASGGTGLGLAIVRAIAEAHGGSVVAASSAEGGARVAFELPGFAPQRTDGPGGTQSTDGRERASGPVPTA
ncbi:MAG TPA: ATP-binding protein [Solirubrobacteraceae bacterium]|jgi:signal transduction histidine kinase|nr:ATP-binding protein [Solirubrobacteraceae bacterium]